MKMTGTDKQIAFATSIIEAIRQALPEAEREVAEVKAAGAAPGADRSALAVRAMRAKSRVTQIGQIVTAVDLMTRIQTEGPEIFAAEGEKDLEMARIVEHLMLREGIYQDGRVRAGDVIEYLKPIFYSLDRS